MKELNERKKLDYNRGTSFFKFVSRSGGAHGYQGIMLLFYIFKRLFNYCFHIFAQFMPYNGLRVFFHKIRGVRISSDVQIGVNVWIDEAYPDYVCIEESASLGIGCKIIAHSAPHPFHEGRLPSYVAPVIINEGALIGMYSIVLPGVTIGKGSIISAGSVVTSDVFPFTIVRGNPAELVGKVRMKPHELEEIKSVGEK
jgi:acetyltransferase-like isoleucine patch superfamily enzyme|tara:strand:+ start:397 stop:990 length:594 start_codon:yes stop_codon:yes gene_type:complete